jgi:Tetratricopeptide repeat
LPKTSSTSLDVALRLDPNLSLAYAARSEVQADMVPAHGAASWEDSLESLSRAIEHDGNNATAYLWRAENYMALGYQDRAIQDYQRSLDIDPAHEVCRRHLAITYLYLGRTDDALRLLEIGWSPMATIRQSGGRATTQHGSSPKVGSEQCSTGIFEIIGASTAFRRSASQSAMLISNPLEYRGLVPARPLFFSFRAHRLTQAPSVPAPEVVVQDPGCFARIVGGPNGASRSSSVLPSWMRKLVIAPSGTPSSL